MARRSTGQSEVNVWYVEESQFIHRKKVIYDQYYAQFQAETTPLCKGLDFSILCFFHHHVRRD